MLTPWVWFSTGWNSLTCVHTWSWSSANRCARSSSLSELLSLSSLSVLGSLSDEEEEEDEVEEEEEEEDDEGWQLIDMAGWSVWGSSGILAKRNSNTSWSGSESKRVKLSTFFFFKIYFCIIIEQGYPIRNSKGPLNKFSIFPGSGAVTVYFQN